MTIIDANVYWFPEEIFADEKLLNRFLADTPAAYDTWVYMRENNGRKEIVVERPKGYAGVNYAQGEYALETQTADLDTAGIDKAVMKVPCCHEWLSIDMCRLFNDGMAEFCRRSGGRFVPLAVVPPLGGETAREELKRCHDMGFKGVQVSCHYGKLYLDDDLFSPFFRQVNDFGMTVYAHHTPVPVDYSSLLAYNNLRRSIGRNEDQLTAVCREMMSDMFAKYPDVKIVHSMLGGGLFTFLSQIAPQKSVNTDTVKRFDDIGDKLRGYLKNNLYFETSHSQPWGKDVLECAVKVYGSDHIVYGSSYPVRMEWLTEGPGFVRNLDISEDDKENILYKNAEKLYL